MGDAVGRVGGVERHIGAARLQDGQRRDHHLRRAGEVEAHMAAGLHPLVAQRRGQRIGARVELGVAQFAILEDQSGGLGRLRRLRGDGAVDGQFGVEIARGVVPRLNRLAPLRGGQDVERAQLGRVPGPGHGTHRRLQPPGEQFGGLLVQPGAVHVQRDTLAAQGHGGGAARQGAALEGQRDARRAGPPDLRVAGDEIARETALGGALSGVGQGVRRFRQCGAAAHLQRHPARDVARSVGLRRGQRGIGERQVGGLFAAAQQGPGQRGERGAIRGQPVRQGDTQRLPLRGAGCRPGQRHRDRGHRGQRLAPVRLIAQRGGERLGQAPGRVRVRAGQHVAGLDQIGG